MYLNLTVPMPVGTGKLSVKRIKNTPYIYYETGQHTMPKRNTTSLRESVSEKPLTTVRE